MATTSGIGGIKEVRGATNNLHIVDSAKFAVEEENKKENRNLEFVRVVSAKQQIVAGQLYYITLEATDGGKKKLYEAKVSEKSWLPEKKVLDFILLGDA